LDSNFIFDGTPGFTGLFGYFKLAVSGRNRQDAIRFANMGRNFVMVLIRPYTGE
jgi:hypothetical protein